MLRRWHIYWDSQVEHLNLHEFCSCDEAWPLDSELYTTDHVSWTFRHSVMYGYIKLFYEQTNPKFWPKWQAKEKQKNIIKVVNINIMFFKLLSELYPFNGRLHSLTPGDTWSVSSTLLIMLPYSTCCLSLVFLKRLQGKACQWGLSRVGKLMY